MMQQTKPMGETVLFFREGHFYPIQLWGAKPPAIEAAEHAALNSGTLRVEDIHGNVLWSAGSPQ